MEDQRHLGSTIQTVFVLKALERVGDHARNIAASVPRFARREEMAPAPAMMAPAVAAPGREAQRDPRALGQG